MADKGFGIKELNLIGAAGVPTIESPNNLNLNAVNVAISTHVSVGDTLKVGVGVTAHAGVITATSFVGTASTATAAATAYALDSSVTIGTATTATYAGSWVLGASGTDHYTFTGDGLSATTNDPEITLQRGQKYIFKNRTGGHPFRIQTTGNDTSGTSYNSGVTNNGGGNGTDIIFEVPHNAPSELYYQCTAHANMSGKIVIGFYDNAILNDISSLALKVNALENLTAYNTESTFVDTYQDSNAVTALTDSTRDTDGEHMKSSTLVETAFNFKTAGTHGQPSMFGLNSWNVNSSSSHAHGWTNDRVSRNNNTSSKYGAAGPKFAFDLRHDFEYYQRCAVDSSGQTHNHPYQASTVVISTKTAADGYVFGKDPTLNGSTIFQAMGDADSEQSGAGLYGALTQSELTTYVFTTAANTSMDISSMTYDTQNGDGNRTPDASTWNAAGGIIRHYYNSGSHSNSHGVMVKFDRSANEMTIGHISSTTGSSFMSTGKTTISNVPSEGFVVFIGGDANGDASTRNYSMSVNNSGSLVGNGTISSGGTNATGSYTSTTITSSASSDISKMGAVVTYTDQSGTTTLNTDLKIYLSANNGTNWTQGTLVAQPNFQTGIKMAKVNDLVISNTGKQLKYKIEWANQSAGSKVAVVNGVALQY